jgi:hypothetical protein
MLMPRLVRPLALDTPGARQEVQSQHLSAASGIVHVGTRLYIVADDEHHLAHLDAREPGRSAIQLVRFAPGPLPAAAAERKRRKPDVEVLLHLPGQVTGGQDLLVLIGSGSRRSRERVFTARLSGSGSLDAPNEVAAASLYAPLVASFGEVNIEGACCDGTRIHLFHRANRGRPHNVRITYEARGFAGWLQGEQEAPAPADTLQFSLGEEAGVPFGITDAAPCAHGGCVFTAVAEDTSDAYRDGACMASLVGCMDAAGRIHGTERLAGAPKIEGIARQPEGDGFWLVTDADDPEQASLLMELRWGGCGCG